MPSSAYPARAMRGVTSYVPVMFISATRQPVTCPALSLLSIIPDGGHIRLQAILKLSFINCSAVRFSKCG